MYCPNCGTLNPNQSATCVKCGVALNTSPTSTGSGAPIAPSTLTPGTANAETNNGNVAIKSNMPLAIVSVFFSLIPGIVAIIYASKVTGLAYQGKVAEARSAAKTAKIWAIVGFCLGAAYLTLQIVILATKN